MTKVFVFTPKDTLTILFPQSPVQLMYRAYFFLSIELIIMLSSVMLNKPDRFVITVGLNGLLIVYSLLYTRQSRLLGICIPL